MKNRITRKLLSLMLILTMVMPLIGCAANSPQTGTNEAQAGDAKQVLAGARDDDAREAAGRRVFIHDLFRFGEEIDH